MIREKNNPGTNEIRLSSGYNAVMWISTKGISRKDEGIVVNIIRRKLRKKLIFVGHCFGRYDLIAEFKADSGKVASNTVCDLQEKIAKKLRAKLKIADPICSSLTLSNKVVSPSDKRKTKMNYPLRIYVFLQPKRNTIDLKEIILKLDPVMELFWITSPYTFVLTANGSNFFEIFRRVLDFRSKTERYFRESCTYVGLDFKKSDMKTQRPIRALTFLKLRKGFGKFRLNKKKNEDKDWHQPEKRLGWSDISLAPKNKHTLRELKDAIMKLRENHRKEIITTSTLLLSNEGEK